MNIMKYTIRLDIEFSCVPDRHNKEITHASATQRLQADSYTNVESHQKALRGGELKRAAADAYFVGIRSATHLNREFFEAATRLTGVGCFCIGTNQVDLAA